MFIPSSHGDEFRQRKLRIFPPQITRRRDAEASLDDIEHLIGSSGLRKEQSWSLYHDGLHLGTNFVHKNISISFEEAGSKDLVAHVNSEASGEIYTVQSNLLVVSEEAEELDWLIRQPMGNESIQWFGKMMDRHRGELNWQSSFDQILRNYIAQSQDPRDEYLRKRAERARFLAFTLHESLIRKIARKILKNDEDAIEEAVQATSDKFLTCQGNFDPRHACGAYLGQMTRNYCLDLKSARKKTGTLSADQLSNVQDSAREIDTFDKGDEESFILELVKDARNEGILNMEDCKILEAFATGTSLEKLAVEFKLTSSESYQARYTAGRRRFEEILIKIRRYVGSRRRWKGGSL